MVRKLRPIGDRILVKVKEQQEVIVNGILRPDIAVEKPMEGLVIAVGKGRFVNGEYIPVDVTVGSVVSFGKYCGNEIDLGTEKFLLLQENELMGEYYEE